jgi:serine carboxypeptidase-like clade 2
MSDEAFANITRHCISDHSDGVACIGAMGAVHRAQIDPYNIYAPICISAANGT